MRVRTFLWGWIISLLASAAAQANGPHAERGQHVFWEVTGEHNTVYLMGSVHLLHSKDRALPDVTEAAYADAETLVEELDIFSVPAEMASAKAVAMQTLPDRQTLNKVLDSDLYALLQKEAAHMGVHMDALNRMQPWYAALVITQARLTKSGFSATDGVDYQLAARAQRDRKPLRALESAVDQLSAFAGMSMDVQRQFLRVTLEESEVGKRVQEITAVWRRGDLVALESLLRSGAEESPTFFKALTTDRNLRWMPQIEAMLADPTGDYLVVTGALHMVGETGLVEQLRRKGYKVERR